MGKGRRAVGLLQCYFKMGDELLRREGGRRGDVEVEVAVVTREGEGGRRDDVEVEAAGVVRDGTVDRMRGSPVVREKEWRLSESEAGTGRVRSKRMEAVGCEVELRVCEGRRRRGPRVGSFFMLSQNDVVSSVG
ncbi:unnamed protein product [Linum trigynum]|uniref:Uncharacterized protein n=1 Tax=Linum trigynum TaxID=586398 RepID=A0AAV2F6J8_9ROSI